MATRPGFDEVLQWLRETDPSRLQQLWDQADRVRKECVGDAVHLRGLLEISNRCSRDCLYCGLRRSNKKIQRYCMSTTEIAECARSVVAHDYGTVVLQAGEGSGIDADWIARVVQVIKEQTNLAVALSLGERKRGELLRWRNAGADRYLLRFETSKRELYDRIHPSDAVFARDRMAVLADLRELGYEVGSGVLIGVPGQSYEDLARDIDWFARLDLDMIGCGPFIAGPDTPLGTREECEALRVELGCAEEDQVPNTQLMGYKAIALARLACPAANIPSTTALATLDAEHGREYGLLRGANVIMPNLTPLEYRRLYEIYPYKASSNDTPEASHSTAMRLLDRMGRTPGVGPGDSPHFAARR